MRALPTIPTTRLVQKYLGGRACSLMTFEIRGGLKAGHALLQCAQAVQAPGEFGRREIPRLPSGIDDASADVAEEQLAAGVAPGGIRLSVGIEHIDDILADLDQALKVAVG